MRLSLSAATFLTLSALPLAGLHAQASVQVSAVIEAPGYSAPAPPSVRLNADAFEVSPTNIRQHGPVLLNSAVTPTPELNVVHHRATLELVKSQAGSRFKTSSTEPAQVLKAAGSHHEITVTWTIAANA